MPNSKSLSQPDSRVHTGIRNLDLLLNGGLPRQTVTVIGGTPGAGKTILTQQICFQNATPENRVLFFQTLSEPTAKTLRYLQQFDFFDAKKLENKSVQFVDLGGIMRAEGLGKASELIMEHVRRVKPSFVVIDSFKVFSDLASSPEELRKFTYEVAVNLMAWECTSFLLGEFQREELQGNPLSSIVDGIFMLTRDPAFGEQRFLQIIKMRGTSHEPEGFPFSISNGGIELYAPRLTITRDPSLTPTSTTLSDRRKLGIPSADILLKSGIPSGSSILISGYSGTGKTLLSLEALYRGAKDLNEKGIYFSFEETPASLLAAGRSFGWDLQTEIQRGMMEFVYIPPTDLLVERDLQLIQRRIQDARARRVVMDPISTFLHQVRDPRLAREKMFQISTLIQNAGAIGLFPTEVPYGSEQLSWFGVEDAAADGVILLGFAEKGAKRERHLEFYKMRNTRHSVGQRLMTFSESGIQVAP